MTSKIIKANSESYKPENSPLIQPPYIQNEQIYINPVIKYTYDCLPKIYGSNNKRKKKYNIILKNRTDFMATNKTNQMKKSPKHQCWHIKKIQDQTVKNRGNSSMSHDKKSQLQCNHDYDNRLTAIKKYQLRNFQISTQNNLNQAKLFKDIVPTPKSSKNINMQALQMLSKPRQKCSNQYCSCKSFYEQYQEEVNKKLKTKNESNRYKRNQSNLRLPKLRRRLQTEGSPDDGQSRHKINSKLRINSLPNQFTQNQSQCYICNNQQSNHFDKGLLGMIKKKQLQKSKIIKNSQKQLNYTEDHATQANFNSPTKKVDQEVNTDFQQFKPQQSGFIYIESKKNSSSKKEDCEHLSKLKQKYRTNKKPQFNPRYQINQDQDYQDHCNDESENNNEDKKKLKKSIRKKKSKLVEETQLIDLNASMTSNMSENFLLDNIARALAVNNQTDKSTIFSLLKKKQIESSNENKSDSKGALSQRQQNRKKNKIDIINSKGLFTIPEQDQYIDYLKNYKPIKQDFKLKELIKSQNFRIIKFKDTIYFGQLSSNQIKHGKALVVTPNQIFQGVYQNGIRMSGCQRNIDGVYIGQFVNGKRHGQGEFKWNNGQIFQGQWKLGTKNGFGIWKSPKGDFYQGNWLFNRQHGKGLYKHKNSIYEGQFKNFIKNGQGKQKFINGDQYIGQYKNGKPHGKGKYIWKNSTVYQGQFVDGLRQGYGIWHEDGSLLYQGQFKKDFKHGKGTQYYKNGDCYEGEFFEGNKVKGTYKQVLNGKQIQIKDNNHQSQIKQTQSPLKKDDNLNILKQGQQKQENCDDSRKQLNQSNLHEINNKNQTSEIEEPKN